MIVFSFLLFVAVSAQNEDSEWKHGFSACYKKKRTMYYYKDNAETCDSGSNNNIISKPPVYNLTCEIPCDRGYYLGADLTQDPPVSTCQKCPQGQYSIGGGVLFAQTTNSWSSPLPDELHTECLTRDMLTGEWNSGCNTWTAEPDGSAVNSGQNKGVVENEMASRLVSLLRISQTLVRPGSITFKYKVDAEQPYDGLLFVIDTDTKMELVSISNGWSEYTTNVTAGTHTFTWQYVKDYTGDKGKDMAWVKSIVLEGTAYADIRCHKCTNDMIQRGDSVCHFCEQNQYAAPSSSSAVDLVCHDCPPNTFAPNGSIGADSCVEKRPCQESDYNVKYSACSNTRTATYFWTQPQTCSTDLDGAVKLPAPKPNLPCGNCTTGHLLSADGSCKPCTGSEYLPSTPQGANACQKCAANTYPYRALQFGSSTEEKWSEWPSVIDSTTAEANNWKLGLESISMDSVHEQKAEWESYKVPMHVEYASAGAFMFVYSLKNLPPASSDVKIWLELYVDDTQISVSNGRKSGVHTEAIPVSTAGMHKFEFNLVCNGTLPNSRAKAEIMQLNFTGTAIGGATTCAKCPPGSVVSEDQSRCVSCPAGTATNPLNKKDGGGKSCDSCPKNFFSEEGADTCTECGNNMVSSPGAGICAVPAILEVTAVPGFSIDTFMYDLAYIQDLTLDTNFSGNTNVTAKTKAHEENNLNEDSFEMWWDDLPTDLMNVTTAFHADSLRHYAFGIFRPAYPTLGAGIQITQPGADKAGNYVMKLEVKNSNEAGGMFSSEARGFGQVQCRVPTVYGYSNIGNHIDSIDGEKDGQGVTVLYTDGEVCDDKGTRHSTVLKFQCDMKFSNTTKLEVAEEDPCKTNIVWRTMRACPICDRSFFVKSRSECDGGNQTVSWKNAIPCSGGEHPSDDTYVQTCTSIVLDDNTIYSIYAVVIGVSCLLLLLIVFVVVIHKKYTRAHEEAKYLKGQLTRNKTGDETVFEFADEGNRVADTPIPDKSEGESMFDQRDSDTDEDEEIDIKLCNGNGKSDDYRSSEDEDDDGEEGEFTVGRKAGSPVLM